ncbi:DNA-binding protein [bacterium D16-76]|nr:DNA-binding protein [bacterium D16-76]
MAKDLKISYLLDFYGDMLTEKQQEVIDAYYNEDLSLAEIAEDWGITRQGVRDAIKRAEQQLTEMEERLGLARRFQGIQGALAAICDCALNIQEQNAQNGQVPEIDDNAAIILEKAEEIAGES